MADFQVLWWNVDWQSASNNDEQIAAVLGLGIRPDVVALSELNGSRARVWRRRLRAEGYTFARSPRGLPDRQLRVLLGARHIDVHGNEVDVHAVHIPNGSANGWVKIDHLLAVRRTLQPPHPVPQVLCGDFNTPQSEAGGRLITFGQTLDGRPRPRPTSTKPFKPERPWDPIAWDHGERAVLEGLPAECDMPDAFRSCHPSAVEATWVPRGRDDERGRRLDHIFASTAFEIISCNHRHEWRYAGLSDHSAVQVTLRLHAQPPNAPP